MSEYLWMFVAISVVGGELEKKCMVYPTEQKCKIGSEEIMNNFGSNVVIGTQCFPIRPKGNRYDGWASLCSKFTKDFERELE